ncbi:MAG: putative cytochrome P450 135B1 [Chroococcopsis gigantea SAG 12.99]|jgi:cytochrome P450|nr:cytochrome P450 [Chlorogloea purpurea SAG 13.99]MDV2999190.1 putative cytochrome P450 135B1 [Chroococcopsis gigantea SAG 12.99]
MTDLLIKELKGPPKSPLLLRRLRGLRFIFNPLEVLEARTAVYGNDYRVSQPGVSSPLIYFSSPEALEALFTAKPDQVSAGKANQILEPLIGEHGIVLLEGTAHQQQRQLLTPPFHGDRMRSYAEVIMEITTRTIAGLDVGKTLTVRPIMQSISLEVILRAVFGLDAGDRYEELKQTLSAMLDGFGSPLGAMVLFYRFLQKDWGDWSPWGRFLRLRRRVDELLYAEITFRRSHPDPSRTDILALLMMAQDTEGKTLSDVELRDELMTLLFAGHETTASALAWAIYWITSLPDVRHKVLQEIETIEGKSVSDPMVISRLPYLSAVCQETLRLYPIAIGAFPRVVKQPVILAGYALEPGTVIMPSIYLAHHRQEVYPESKKFRPERFLERQFSPYEYLPFGGGNRRCIGSAFAMFEMKLVLFQFLSTLEMKPVHTQPIKPTRRGLTIAPSDKLKLGVKLRYSQIKSENSYLKPELI